MLDSPLIPGSPAPHSQCHRRYSRESYSVNDPPISLCASLTDGQKRCCLSAEAQQGEQSACIAALPPWHRVAERNVRSRSKCASAQGKVAFFLCCSVRRAHSCGVKLIKTDKSPQGREPGRSFPHGQTYSSLVLVSLRCSNHYTEINF